MTELERYIVFSKHFNQNPYFNVDTVGQKGVGLFLLEPQFVPPYFVIKSNLFTLWLKEKVLAKKILKNLLLQASQVLEENQKLFFIARSSAKIESFEERGFYESSRGNLKNNELLDAILQIWENNDSSIKKYPNNEFSVIVQQYIKPRYSGHLSNERRVSRNKNEWLIEIVSKKEEFLSSVKFISKKSTETLVPEDFICRNKTLLLAALKKFAGTQSERTHIEWVWDGIRVYLVQNDFQTNDLIGDRPGSSWRRSKKILAEAKLEFFNSVATSSNKWKKVDCLRTFINCNLPHGQVYILENSKVIDDLSLSISDPLLIDDLSWLLHYPIIIRMDVENPDGINNILLPRTETLFTVDQALEFLFKHSKEFIKNGQRPDTFCFLIHRFIISDSCALAFSKPHIPKARIDSTWGIVEGLYFHPHDSFEVNLMNQSPQIKKQIRCKTEYIDVDEKGKWFSKKSGIEYDWAESLTKKQINNIAQCNIKISEYLDSVVTVMYFVGVDQSTGYPEVLPWFYTTDETAESSEKFTDVIFSEKRFLIECEDDFTKLQKSYASELWDKITIKMKLNPDISRDKSLIESIGNFAKANNLAIELSGSILSHTYYILTKLNVRVKCLDAFEPKYKKQDFYKLVRDKIPINIRLKGERARTVQIPSKELLQFLKEKAIEEAFEFYFENNEDKIIEELADLFEVTKAACKIFGVPIEELIQIANKKTEKKGGFETGVVLINTEESSLIDVTDRSGVSLLAKEKDKKARGKIIKQRKISFGVDNSITLPYILDDKKNDQKKINIPFNFNDITELQISYTPKGIRISIIKNNATDTESSQLGLPF